MALNFIGTSFQKCVVAVLKELRYYDHYLMILGEHLTSLDTLSTGQLSHRIVDPNKLNSYL